jgi:Reverse transcriptase (RNA-dependent DNA polymerase)
MCVLLLSSLCSCASPEARPALSSWLRAPFCPGVPTVADRVAQMVVKQVIEPILDPIFLADSYGYRPNKSALDAVGATRERCWKYDWVLEFDIKGLLTTLTTSSCYGLFGNT